MNLQCVIQMKRLSASAGQPVSASHAEARYKRDRF
jgi:hypothetical protein